MQPSDDPIVCLSEARQDTTSQPARQGGNGTGERRKKGLQETQETQENDSHQDGIASQTAAYLDWKVISKLHAETGSVVVEAKRCQVEISLDPLGS